MRMRILIVDDDELFLSQLTKALVTKKHFIKGSNCLTTAARELQSKVYDVILLDLQLGCESGLDLFPKIAHFSYRPYVIMMTSHASKSVAIDALNLGVDKFLEKPFLIGELYKILDSLVKGNTRGKLVLNPTSQSALENKKEVPLTEIEYMIANLLIQNSNALVTKDEIHEYVYKTDIRSKNSLNTHLTNLKKKLPYTFAKDLKAIRGKGYIYECNT